MGIWMAYHGFGVWTLVWQPLLQNFLNVALLWVSAGWMPSFVFSIRSFKGLFGFGSRFVDESDFACYLCEWKFFVDRKVLFISSDRFV